MPRLADDTRQAVINDLQKGLSQNEIMEKHQVSRSTLHRVKKAWEADVEDTRAKAIVSLSQKKKEATESFSSKPTEDIDTILEKHEEELQEKAKQQEIEPDSEDEKESVAPPPPPPHSEPKPSFYDPMKANLVSQFMNQNEQKPSNPLPLPPAPQKKRPASKRKPKVSIPHPLQVMEEEHRAELIHKLYLNVINFEEHLTSITDDPKKFLKDIHKRSTPELASMLKLVETQRSMGNMKNQLKHTFLTVSRGAEVVLGKFLKVGGLTDEFVKQERELDMIFQEMAITYAENIKQYMKPEVRLLMMFTSTALRLDSKNRMEEKVQEFYSKQPQPETKHKYEDL